jgi:hypothetical protein
MTSQIAYVTGIYSTLADCSFQLLNYFKPDTENKPLALLNCKNILLMFITAHDNQIQAEGLTHCNFATPSLLA